MEGESGRNELLRGPFALFGVRSSAKLVRDLAKHRRTPMSPPQLIPPTSPGQVIAGTEDSGGSFRGTGHGPFRALIVSNLKWGGPCRGHYVFPQADTKSSAFYKGAMKAYRISRSRKLLVAATRSAPHLTRETFSGRRPADGADTPGGVFRPGENLALGRRGR